MSETALMVATLAAGVGQIISGVSAKQAVSEKADLQGQQAQIALDEANQQADQKVVERRKFLAEQRMAYLASGVSLAGTPGIVQTETFKEFQMEIEALRKSGVAQYRLGVMESANTESSGRAQMLSGVLSGVGTMAQGLYSVSQNSLKKKESNTDEK